MCICLLAFWMPVAFWERLQKGSDKTGCRNGWTNGGADVFGLRRVFAFAVAILLSTVQIFGLFNKKGS